MTDGEWWGLGYGLLVGMLAMDVMWLITVRKSLRGAPAWFWMFHGLLIGGIATALFIGSFTRPVEGYARSAELLWPGTGSGGVGLHVPAGVVTSVTAS